MSILEKLLWRAINWLLVLLIGVMFLMVFGNVVLRYAFNSGIEYSEELSRFAFVWLTFIGAVAVAKDGAHLNVEILVGAVSPRTRMMLLIASDFIVLLCCFLLVYGTWRSLGINASNYSPIVGISYAWVYGIGLFSGGVIGLLTASRLVRAATGRLSQEELDRFAGKFADQEVAAIRSHTE
ncbi:TRAP transporter small permease [Mesorhizobium sp.]|uniref:TRAP transporter small permease n=1 Tax=Mesorhizobium sp. TaxID=1871066 RepID=UPI0025D131EF|nr:TRAP transporter small permease [Mesorhizobium sp.]